MKDLFGLDLKDKNKPTRLGGSWERKMFLSLGHNIKEENEHNGGKQAY